MKLTIRTLFLVILFSQCKKKPVEPVISQTAPVFAIAIHGGAGTILKENMSPELEVQYKTTLEKAIRTGYAVLQAGGSSIDAVEQTIVILEDSPLFNAGKGAVFTHNGKNELDASIMEGNICKAGAVAGVTTVKNPIRLARAVMEKSPHVMLAREGAEQFALENGIELVEPSYFYTQSRYDALKKAQEEETIELDHSGKSAFYNPLAKDGKFGTVGCVALDKNGNLAAGTSTGGMTNKRWGRVGDSPIIGAGTYANNATCAVSATGWGEFFIRSVAAYDVSALMAYGRRTVEEAAKEVIHKKIPALGGDGGLIAIDAKGVITMPFNTAGMYRAAIDKNGNLTIGIYKNE